MKLFPILNSNIFHAIPWEVIEAHELQAQINHTQSLERLAEHGGLTPCEAMAVIEGKRYRERWPSLWTASQGQEADERLLEAVSCMFCTEQH